MFNPGINKMKGIWMRVSGKSCCVGARELGKHRVNRFRRTVNIKNILAKVKRNVRSEVS